MSMIGESLCIYIARIWEITRTHNVFYYCTSHEPRYRMRITIYYYYIYYYSLQFSRVHAHTPIYN